MLMGSYQTPEDQYENEMIDGLGFSFKKAFKKIRRKVSKTIPLYKQQKKLFDKSVKAHKRITKKTVAAIKKSPGYKGTKKILRKSQAAHKKVFNSSKAIHKRFAKIALKTGRRIPGFKQHEKLLRKSVAGHKKVLRKMPGYKQHKKLVKKYGKDVIANMLVPGAGLMRRTRRGFRGRRRIIERLKRVPFPVKSTIMPAVPGIFFDRVTSKWGPRKLSAAINKARRKIERLPTPPERSVTPERQAFLDWSENIAPGLYEKFKERMQSARRMQGRTISGLTIEGDDLALGGLWDDVKGTLTDVMSTGLQMKQQRDLYKLQLSRAEKGLPPLNADQVSPQIRTQIEIGPETRAQLFTEAGAGLKNLAVPLAVGAAAIFMFTRK